MGQTEPRGAEAAAPGDVRIRRALLSVSDKRGLLEFARGLADLGVQIVSTGGTAGELQAEGVATRPVEDYTGFPEILDGRVKTLNPRIYAGLLGVRSNPGHIAALQEHEIEPIDLVCVNLYPFERVSSRRGVEDDEVIENIDIGGPTLIRAAAKNHPYAAVLDELRESGGRLSGRTRESLAMEAFAYTARYDTAISRWFAEREEDFPAQYTRSYEKVLDLSYGENPHQRAVFYAEVGARTHLLSMVSKLHGQELSFNNLLDLEAGRRLVEDFELPTAAIVKHNNPCGAGVGADLVEAVFAPGYDEAALELLQQKPNIRILENQERRRVPAGAHDMKRVRGGLLVQDPDTGLELRDEMRIVTRRKPSESEWGELLFALRVCKHVRSNAIVIASGLGTAGIGAGQMSRVDSVRIAVDKASAAELPLHGAAMASDAFFPFADGPKVAIDAGIRAIIQPGGSQRDAEVVEACDAADVAMVFTARRHFRH